MPASYGRYPGSIMKQSMWDLWWAKWHWDTLFLPVIRFSPVGIIPPIRFSPVGIIPPMLHTHFCLSTALVWRTNACSLGTSQKERATVGRQVVSAVCSAWWNRVRGSVGPRAIKLPSAISKSVLAPSLTRVWRRQGREWVVSCAQIVNLLQHSSKCVQIATLLFLAATKGTISRSLHLHYDCLHVCRQEKRNYWPDCSVTYWQIH